MDDYNLYSSTQQLILGILPYCSAPPSALGSALIIYAIAANKHTEIQTYQRLMLGMSILDFASSFGMIVLGHWAVPAGTDFVSGAAGTDATCAASFFLLNCLFGSMLYSVSLAVYFMLVVRFDWPKKRIARWCEPFGHFAAVTVTVAVPIFPVVNQDIHPLYVLPGFCWTANDPPGCTMDENPDCIVVDVPTGASHGLIILSFGVIIICMILMIERVRRTDEYVQRYAVGEHSHPGKNKEVAKEALLYIGSFFIVFLPVVLLMFSPEKPTSTSRNRTFFFAIAFLMKFLSPMQGFFNCIIFLRGRFLAFTQERESHMTLSMFVACLHATEPTERIEQTEDANSQREQPGSGCRRVDGEAPECRAMNGELPP